MKAIHGGKTKNDKIDSYKITMLLKGGNFPTAYPYPAKWRASRDLLRRRMYISRRCSELVKWAVKDAAILMLRGSAEAKYFVSKLERKYNKGKALGIFTHKLGRAIYFMLKNKEAFDMKRFFEKWAWNRKVPACGLTEITRVDLMLSIETMQPDCQKRVDQIPEARCA